MLVRYVGQRLLASLWVVLGVTTVTFVVMHVTAGNYVPGLEISIDTRPEDAARLRQQLGLDQPLYVQYWTWISGILFRGDFGRSLIDNSTVMSHVGDRLPNTLLLTATAIGRGRAPVLARTALDPLFLSLAPPVGPALAPIERRSRCAHPGL
jgi:peptide/nickel transport system permease protein